MLYVYTVHAVCKYMCVVCFVGYGYHICVYSLRMHLCVWVCVLCACVLSARVYVYAVCGVCWISMNAYLEALESKQQHVEKQ